MSKRSGTKGFILCSLVILLVFLSGAAFGADNNSDITRNLDGEHGLVADSLGALWRNYAKITINGNEAYGMLGTDGAEIHNAVKTNRTGSILTTGEASHGMVAEGGAKAFNERSLTRIGTVLTTGPNSHGMVALGGSYAENLGSIVTEGKDSFGMWARDASSIVRNDSYGGVLGIGGYSGSILTKGDGSHGMVAEGGAQVFNEGSLGLGGDFGFPYIELNPGRAEITTEGKGSHGMVASGDGSAAWNAGNILTKGVGSFGILAEDGGVAHNYSQVYEEANINLDMGILGGVKGRGILSLPITGRITTESKDSHGMVASGSGSQAWNPGSILTKGDDAYGMYASDGGMAFNFDLAKIAWDLEISTKPPFSSKWSTQYETSGDLPILPLVGKIVTEGEGSHGMVAERGSIVANAGLNFNEILGLLGPVLPEGVESIIEQNIENIGIYDGSITTKGDEAYGMWANDTSLAVNLGTIETEGFGSHGMVADHWSAAINAGIFAGILPGTISTSGDEAYGMWAHDWAAAVNAGTIGTSGDRSHGMVAEKGSLAVNFGLGSDVSGFLGDIVGGLGDFDLGDFSDYLGMLGDLLGGGILPGKIETEGDDAHGMVARNWAAAINLSEIATHGEESYGMHAEDFGLALNMGDIATEKYGSHGMVAEEGSIAVNAGSLLSLGSGLFDLIPGDFFEGIFGDEGGVGQIADGLVGILGSLFGGGSSTIETWGDDAHGMMARNWSAAINLDEIVTHGNDSYGMLAENFSLALNLSANSIETFGGGGQGMVADHFSLGLNTGSIATHGWDSHGMLAEDHSLIVNTGTIRLGGAGEEPNGNGENGNNSNNGNNIKSMSQSQQMPNGGGAHGMVARNWSAAINTGSILVGAPGFTDTDTGEDEGDGNNQEPYGFSLFAVLPDGPPENGGDEKREPSPEGGSYGMLAEDHSLIANLSANSIETWLDGAHGMVADTFGLALNTGAITTHGNSANGMWAKNQSLALNFGDIVTEGGQSYGMRIQDESFGLSTGSITTGGQDSVGMLVERTSIGLNSGSIETSGPGAHGMEAFDSSIIANLGGGKVETTGEGAHGMFAHNSLALNMGTIVTGGESAYGMKAEDHSLIVNLSTNSIETFGGGAHGMVADHFSLGLNTGSITTHGNLANGMVAKNWSLALNLGDISTEGGQSYGMRVQDESFGLNTGSIMTGGQDSVGMLVERFSSALNFGSIKTDGLSAHGMEAFDHSLIANLGDGKIESTGEGAHGMLAHNSLALNTGTIVTGGESAYGMKAEGISTAINTGKVETKGDMAHGMSVTKALAVNTGEIVTSGKEAHGMDATEALAVNTGTIATKGVEADAVKLNNSTLINAGVLDSAQGDALSASDHSLAVLLDGTKLEGSHTLEDMDGDSNLVVWMNDDLAAKVDNFGRLFKAGGGTLLVEDGSSVVGKTLTAQGTLAIEAGTQFTTGTYDQWSGGALYLYANPASVTDPDAVPLWVEGVQDIKGSVYIDMSTATMPGHFKYIRAENDSWNFDTYFVNVNPYFIPYDPLWITGSSYFYTSYLGYNFSHAALGLVATIDDWSLLRYAMANHLNDVADCMKSLEVGEKKIHAQVLAGQTKRDPASATSAGFDSTQKGISLGFDKKQNDSTLWGLYVGYTEKDIDFTGLPMVYADWESQDTWHFGAYISKRWDKWILSDTLTYRSASHSTFRKQVGGDARASFDSWAVTNDLRLGYVAKEIGEGSHWQVIPEVGLNVGYINRGGYTEDKGFTYGDFSNTVVESVVGIRFKGEYLRGDGSTFIPQLRLGWVHVLSGEDITIDQSWGGTTSWFT
ncbi:MAG: autotransporter domain-containing protein, partial [Thermovirgaceae bacterium]